MSRILALITMIFLPNHLYATCFNFKNFEIESRIKIEIDSMGGTNLNEMEFICKKWALNEGKYIILKPFTYLKNTPNLGSEEFLGALIFILNERNGAIESYTIDTKLADIDAFYPKISFIDTTKFEISSSELAFGVRVNKKNAMSIISAEEEYLNLYVEKEGGIKLIAHQLPVTLKVRDTSGPCISRDIDSRSVINIDKTVVNGKRQLILATKIKEKSYGIFNGSCKLLKSAEKTKREPMYYDGKLYKLATQ